MKKATEAQPGWRNPEIYICIMVFLSVFVLVGAIKQDALFSNALFGDDMTLFRGSIYGNLGEKGLLLYFYSLSFMLAAPLKHINIVLYLKQMGCQKF